MRQDLSTFQAALYLFEMNAGSFPTNEEGLAALVEKPVGDGHEKWEQTLRKEQLDPWGNSYRYEYPSTHGLDQPDVSSSGPDMIFGTEDDICNWDEE